MSNTIKDAKSKFAQDLYSIHMGVGDAAMIIVFADKYLQAYKAELVSKIEAKKWNNDKVSSHTTELMVGIRNSTLEEAINIIKGDKV